MSWKVSPKKVMVTLLLIMITVYHSMTMLYYIEGMDSSFLREEVYYRHSNNDLGNIYYCRIQVA